MLVEYLRYGELHHWRNFCCVVATLGLVGAFWVALAATTGKGVFAFLNGSRQPTVIVVNGGHYTPQPVKRRWTFGRYWLLFAAIFSGGPMLTLLLMAANQAAQAGINWVGAHWFLLPIVGILVVSGLMVLLYARRSRQEPDSLAVLDMRQAPTTMSAQPMWSMPEHYND